MRAISRFERRTSAHSIMGCCRRVPVVGDLSVGRNLRYTVVPASGSHRMAIWVILIW